MASISFPDVSESMLDKNGYDSWVLYHPGKKQFYGFVSRAVNYGYTDEPVVTCTGSYSVTPINKSYAEALLRLAQAARYFDDDMRNLVIRKVHMTPYPTDRNRYTWAFVDAA